MKTIYGRGDRFPVCAVAIEDIPSGSQVPPPVGRNPEMAFDLGSFDSERMEQLIGIMRGMGFIVQNIFIDQKPHEFSMCSIKFGQTDDPRIKHEEAAQVG